MMRPGFSLVELSIVLVILGLLVGGILAAQSLIRASEMKAQINQTVRLETIVLSFKDKYLCIPGDCPRMTSFFTAGSQPQRVTNGDGDGKIYAAVGYSSSVTNSAYGGWGYEFAKVFDHLAAADMVEMAQYDETISATTAQGVGYPLMKMDPRSGILIAYEFGAYHIHDGNKFRWGTYDNGGGGVYHRGYTPQETWQFDTKMDDGFPLSGRFYVVSFPYIYRVPGDPNDSLGSTCIVGTTNVYQLSSTTRNCYIDIDAKF